MDTRRARLGDSIRLCCVALALIALSARPAAGQGADTIRFGYTPAQCASCAGWNAALRPFLIFGNAYYVGTQGLSAILLTSSEGHVLIDGGLPESAPQILENIRALGFRIEDVELILNSHAHYDHAGGIATLQRASGARVAASPWNAAALRRGETGPEDPQRSTSLRYPRVDAVDELRDREPQRVGPIVLTPYFTAGHTPGGTSWTWRSCEGERCLDFVHADSQTPVSDDDFLFTRNRRYPSAWRDFEHGFAVLEQLPCDVLLAPHPGFTRLFQRIAARDRGDASALVQPGQCRQYIATARERFSERIATEEMRPQPPN